MRLSSLFLPLVTFFSLVPSTVSAAGNGRLFTNSVTYCAEARSIIVDSFEIALNQWNSSITFSFSVASVDPSLNVSVALYANAYGIQIIDETLNLCDFLEGVICPLPQVNFTGYGTYPIPQRYLEQLPSIAWTIADLEGYARVEFLREGSGEVAACLQATLSNGLTTELKSVKIATAIFTLVALLVGLFHAAILVSPSPAQYRWFDILYLYQTAACTGLFHLNYPLVHSHFVQNFAWALSMFHSTSMQNSINSMRSKTGGNMTGEAYPDVQYINRKLSPYNVMTVDLNQYDSSPSVFNSLMATMPRPDTDALFERGLVSRATLPSALASNLTTSLDTGIPAYTNTNSIPEANIYTTVFFFFLAFIGIAIAFHVLLFPIVAIFDRRSRRGHKGAWAIRLRKNWWEFCAGNALRVCLIWFIPIWVFGFWQFFIGDSKLAIFFAVFGILLTFVPLATVFVLSVLKNRKTSSTAPGISPLYTSFRWFHSVGALYRPYRQRFHFFWFAPLVLGMIARAGFIAFGPDNAWAAVIGNVVIEGLVLIALIACRPHKDRKGDWLSPFLAFVRMVAFGLLIAFIPSMEVRPIPRAVIGYVEIAVIGIPTVLLLLGLIWNAGYGYLWRRHTHRIEDGLEIERFTASDDDLQARQAMTQSHVDASHFVTAPAAMASRNALSSQHDDSSGNVPSLTRRTSVMEPVGMTYEPNNRYSNASNYGQNGYDASATQYAPTSPTYGYDNSDNRYSGAYEDAANGAHPYQAPYPPQDYHTGGDGGMPPNSRQSTGTTTYYTPGVGQDSAQPRY